MKTCPCCKQSKPLLEFYKNHSRKDGLSGFCKCCDKIKGGNYRNSPQGKKTKRFYDKKYAKTEQFKISQNKYKHSDKGKQNRTLCHQHQKERYPEKIKARGAVGTVVHRKKLLPALSFKCTYCPEQATQYHHHKGYNKKHWLDVVPSCRSCDRKIHSNHPEIFQ